MQQQRPTQPAAPKTKNLFQLELEKYTARQKQEEPVKKSAKAKPETKSETDSE